jgi:hypothetical protein
MRQKAWRLSPTAGAAAVAIRKRAARFGGKAGAMAAMILFCVILAGVGIGCAFSGGLAIASAGTAWALSGFAWHALIPSAPHAVFKTVMGLSALAGAGAGVVSCVCKARAREKNSGSGRWLPSSENWARGLTDFEFCAPLAKRQMMAINDWASRLEALAEGKAEWRRSDAKMLWIGPLIPLYGVCMSGALVSFLALATIICATMLLEGALWALAAPKGAIAFALRGTGGYLGVKPAAGAKPKTPGWLERLALEEPEELARRERKEIERACAASARANGDEPASEQAKGRRL